MAKPQRQIGVEIKRKLVQEAGGKCANPGCSNWRVHFHHIKHWAVYKAHDAEDLIAVCPSCHDACHHGSLKITDERLYEWKGISRAAHPATAHIYKQRGQVHLLDAVNEPDPFASEEAIKRS